MKNVDNIKEIFSQLPNELNFENPPTAKIESKTFEQVFAPIIQLIANNNNTLNKDIMTSDAAEHLIKLLVEARPHINDREKLAKNGKLVQVLENLKVTILEAENNTKSEK